MALVTSNWQETFNTVDPKLWWTSVNTIPSSWIDTSWSSDNVSIVNNDDLRLELNTTDRNGKSFTGGEVTTRDTFGFGRYEVTMKASGEAGVNSAFFSYTGPAHGTKWNEIDFEFLGRDPTKVSIAYHNDGQSWSKLVDLGFDASASFHEYAFEWEPGQIRWYAGDDLLYTVVDGAVAMPTIASKMIMSIWSGMPNWMGEATFTGETEAVYRDVSFQPYKAGLNYDGTTRATPPVSEGVLGKDAVGLFLVNTNTEAVIGRITDGTSFTLPDHELDNLAVVARGAGVYEKAVRIDSVKFGLSGSQTANVIDNAGPFAIFGDNWEGPNPGLTGGTFSLKTSAYSKDNATGTLLSHSDIDFTIRGASGATKAPPTELMLYDAKTDTYLTHLYDGAVLNSADLGSGNLAIRAKGVGPTASTVQSFTLDLQGPLSAKTTDNMPAYTLFGSSGTDYAGKLFPAGEYRLLSTSWTQDRGLGSIIDAREIDFTITSGTQAPPPAPSPFVLQLVNADTDKVVATVTDGARIDLDALGVTNVTFVARAASASLDANTQSITFDLDGPVDHQQTENFSPYAIFGDIRGRDLLGKSLAEGAYQLELDAYSKDHALGTLLASQDYDFFLI